jgi:general secretion pathway protein M
MADLAAFRSEMRRQVEDLASRVMASDAGQRLLGVYDQLGERDRMALRGLSWFAAAVLVYLAAISPLVAHVDSALRRLESEQALLSWLKSHDPAATGASTVIAQRDEPLATIVNATAEEGGLAIRRYEPSGEDGVRVWMEGASFNAFVKWLYVLEGTHGIRAAEFNIERENEPGKVSVRITLRG